MCARKFVRKGAITAFVMFRTNPAMLSVASGRQQQHWPPVPGHSIVRTREISVVKKRLVSLIGSIGIRPMINIRGTRARRIDHIPYHFCIISVTKATDNI